jgi:aspartate oxidase
MKTHTQVAVIGGGVVGASVLYHLAKAGWTDIVLIERDELTSGSTWHAAGGMHTLNGDPNVAKLQEYTIKLYREILHVGLKEAKDLVDGAPKPIKEAINKEEAEAIKKKFTEAGQLEKHLNKQGLLDQFTRYASENRVKTDHEGLKTSNRIIHTQIKAYIARNILDNRGFYPIWEEIDTTLKYAVKFLEK